MMKINREVPDGMEENVLNFFLQETKVDFGEKFELLTWLKLYPYNTVFIDGDESSPSVFWST